MTQNNREALRYGAVVFAAVAFVGWITGMGGSMLPNLLFAAAMGILAGALFALMKWKLGPGNGSVRSNHTGRAGDDEG